LIAKVGIHRFSDIGAKRSIGRSGLIVLKNSKIRLPHFSANFQCFIKVDFNCQVQAMTCSHIAEPVFWPTP